MAGISTLDVDDKQSIATVHAALDAGINHFDTAFSYGYDGRSDRVLRTALESRSEPVVVATKVGMHYDANHQRVLDASPGRLRLEVDAIRKRLNRDVLELLYLHSPDADTPIESSAETLATFVEQGVVRYVGVSNVSPEQATRFASVIQPVVIQPPFNMLQQESVQSLLPFCQSNQCAIACYWPLMKGLLAGKMARDHQFDPRDRRLTYSIFQGESWGRAQDFLDSLRVIGRQTNLSIATIVTAWTLNQSGITTVLCGAKRPEQIHESAAAMRIQLANEHMQVINTAIALFQNRMSNE
jgi:aryl-alcohol dehydrogenase-like predicted oxidoreductase